MRMWLVLLTLIVSACSADVPDITHEPTGAAGSDARPAAITQALNTGDYNVWNNDANPAVGGRLAYLGGVVRGVFPQCWAHMYSGSDGTRYAQLQGRGCSALVYTFGCVTTAPNAERCELGIGFAHAGYMQVTEQLPAHHWDGSGHWGQCPNNVFTMDNTSTKILPYCER